MVSGKRTWPTTGLLVWMAVTCCVSLTFKISRADAEGHHNAPDPTVAPMRSLIDRYTLDFGNLRRFYNLPFSETTLKRMDAFHKEYQGYLERVKFDELNQDGKVDYLLFRTHLFYERKELETESRRIAEVQSLIPWMEVLIGLMEARQRVEPIDPPAIGETLHQLDKTINSTLAEWKKAGTENIDPIIANRTARTIDQLSRQLGEWSGFYDGYHPAFTWWVARTEKSVRESLRQSSDWLRKEVAGYRDGEDAPLLGDPIGRGPLLDALSREWISYTPEQLIDIAKQEMAWCLEERKKAARKMGFGDDWKAAQNHVKNLHVAPGEQPQLIKKLAREAEAFLDERDLLTIPDVARETWRMQMMSPERQKVNPYFTGGEVISVSFPTAEMEHDHKLMSLRGNNVHFSKATVHHELIPGHHLQLYMAERYNAHRQLFRTPFLVEGWALYWEMLLWDLEFADNPEDRIGMLFWRSHRCARIIFSLSFHLGIMSPQECIDYLVENVGHEVRNATAEVRRSIQGGYSPLYQAAYMLGGLQIRQLSRELVDNQGWSHKKFHDAILKENSIPIEFIRFSLSDIELTPDTQSDWMFYPGMKPSEAAVDKPVSRPAARVRSEAPRAWRVSIEPQWYDGNSRFWYRVETGDNRFEFISVDAGSGTRMPAFDHQAVAGKISALTGNPVDPDQLPVDTLEFDTENQKLTLIGPQSSWILDLSSGNLTSSDSQSDIGLNKYDAPIPSGANGPETEIRFVNNLEKAINIFWVDSDSNERHYHKLEAGGSIAQHTFAGHGWLARTEDGSLAGAFVATRRMATAYLDDSQPQAYQSRRQRGRNRNQNDSGHSGIVSSDKKWRAFTREHNLFAENLENGAVIQLTHDATPDHSFQQNGQREKFMGMRYEFEGYPDHLPKAWWSPDSRFLIAMKSTKVAEHIVHMVQSSPKDQLQPVLHSIPYFKPGDPIPVEKPHLFHIESGTEIPVDDTLFENPWSLGSMQWLPDSSEFIFVYNQRGHSVMRAIAINADSGKTRAIVNEECETFFDYAGKMFFRILTDSNEAIWMSERDGWNHLYLYDIKSGTVKNRITSGQWVVRGVENVDTENRQITFTAGGIHPGQDPYHLHYCRVNFDGSNLVVLTEGDGTHEWTLSPDNRYFIDRYSRVDMAPVHELRRMNDGSLITVLEKGDTSEYDLTGRSLPERLSAPGRDGSTPIYGIIHFPDNFNPNKKYPVIENIYAGPHSAHVPKNFRTSFRRQQEIANLGFIVVQIDGMGTSHRSKAFHDVCWKNIADAGFPDRIAWIRTAAKKYPQMDLNRVGIFGGSAGGQNALGALLTHPDFYKAAVADCGCHDNRMDKIWWNELWMSYPIDDHYEAQSNATLAHNLQGDLLLLLGEMDKNVDPASTMQVVNKLVEADKDFEMLILPNVGHGAAGSAYGWKKLKSFFIDKLL